ncbi:MAG: protein-L-isoaspartate(D-aspartate) O-methyltransferase [Geminicoccaceae bacterium]
MLAWLIALIAVLATPVLAQESTHDPDLERAAMVRMIEIEARMAAAETGVGTIAPEILEAMGQVPRHEFVPAELRDYAYLPMPLPVHPEQNIAAPYLVALMTQLAAVAPGSRVFETGTGEGYHAAVLSRLAGEVFSVEVVPELAQAATERLHALGYDTVWVREGDGYYGWPEAAPFDAILVKEAVDHVPAPLLAQLRPGGRMVMPLGPLDGPQELTVVEKLPDGRHRQRPVLAVRFTPLQGGERI